MNNTFTFDSAQYNFWPIYDCIKQYYPLGIPKNYGEGIYVEYKGFTDMEKIIVDNIHDAETYKRNWVSFTKRMSVELGLKVFGTTYGQAPSYSAYLLSTSKKEGNRWYYKELHFSVSLLGKFFQIYGLHKTQLSYEDEPISYSVENIKEIITSPHDEFKESFAAVEQKIIQQFKGYRLVPFSIGQLVLNGLEVYHTDKESSTVNMALFNHLLDDEIMDVDVIGNSDYGIDSWKK